jgi:hypothetical protein
MSVALLEYLQQQPGTTFKRLYEKPSTVLAILRRMLPHLGMHYGPCDPACSSTYRPQQPRTSSWQCSTCQSPSSNQTYTSGYTRMQDRMLEFKGLESCAATNRSTVNGTNPCQFSNAFIFSLWSLSHQLLVPIASTVLLHSPYDRHLQAMAPAIHLAPPAILLLLRI